MNQIKNQKIIFNTVAIILFLFNPFFSIAQEKKINIQNNSISIESAFTQIEKQTGYSIAYDRSKIDVKKKISLSLKNASLAKAFSETLKGTKLTYKINGYHIILIPQKKVESEKKNTKLTQTIRGVVTDGASGQPIAYATVVLLNTYQGVLTDSLGVFNFDKIPIGRYDIEISSIGYESNIIKEVQLISAKESYREVKLKELILQLGEIIVRPTISKEKPLNQMALAGGRMISVEEASRFAGGMDDPARLVSSFAGVAGGTSSTALSIRGNSPQFLQWKLEGIEIPYPSHFSDMTGVGGGVYTALSSQVMGNSDFFNGAFPAEYSNAISGVFDMSMRNGNNQNHEHTFQAGILGIDFASEGPISKKQGSSYIFNYRYFDTAPIKGLTGGLSMKFQDLSFKLNFPTKKSGTFSFWGFGLIDDFTSLALSDKTKWEESIDRQNQKLDFGRFATGITNKIFIGNGTHIKSSLSATYADNSRYIESAEDREPFAMKPVMDMTNTDFNISFNSYINKKFSARHTNRTGFSVSRLFYDLDYKFNELYDKIAPEIGSMDQIVNGASSSSFISVFSNSLIDITDRLSTNIGITSQLFMLNNSWSLEPRVSLKYKLTHRSTLALAYGLHSKREKLDYYYVQRPETGDKLVNKDLDFAKAHHLVLSYSLGITDNIYLRIEPYYQYLFNIPVEAGSSFSIINHNLFYLDRALVNEGEGRNFGIDVTLERYLNKGYYWMLTGSLFNSTYKGGDGKWRDTKYNREFIANAIIGKEWMCGKNKQNVFSLNIGLMYQGGEYDIPIDEVASREEGRVVYDEITGFSTKLPSTVTVDFSIGYKINRPKVSHEFFIKVLNATGASDQNGHAYNSKTGEITRVETPVIIPNIGYKIFF